MPQDEDEDDDSSSSWAAFVTRRIFVMKRHNRITCSIALSCCLFEAEFLPPMVPWRGLVESNGAEKWCGVV